MSKIQYKEGYKYQLASEYSVFVEIRPERELVSDFVTLESNGLLTLAKGYAWDGASGPAFDTKNFMRGSLVHDALCQLMTEKLLDKDTHWVPAAEEMRKICLEDGMSRIRAWWCFKAVCWFGNSVLSPEENQVLEAP